MWVRVRVQSEDITLPGLLLPAGFGLYHFDPTSFIRMHGLSVSVQSTDHRCRKVTIELYINTITSADVSANCIASGIPSFTYI